MKKQEEILNGQVNGTLTEGKGEQLITRERVQGTPFDIITHEGRSFIALGRLKLTEDERTPEELTWAIQDMEWEFLIALIIALVASSNMIVTERETIEGTMVEK